MKDVEEYSKEGYESKSAVLLLLLLITVMIRPVAFSVAPGRSHLLL
jgi:hypothetical protein